MTLQSKLLKHSPLFNMDKYLDLLKIHFIDYNEENTDESNLMWDSKNDPIEDTVHPGFFIIPCNSEYAVSKDGKVISRLTNTLHAGTKDNSGYISMPCGIHGKLGIHRAMLLTFKDIPINVTDILGNHIDGIKWNNYLPNLEWATYSGNLVHAYNNGLRDNAIYVTLTEIGTGITTGYRSIEQCCRATSASYRHIRFAGRNNTLLNDRYVVELTIEDSREYECYARCIETNGLYIANGYCELANIMSLSVDDTRVGLRGHPRSGYAGIRKWPYLGYEFGWRSIAPPRTRVYSVEEIEAFKSATVITNPIKVTIDNVVTIYCSLLEYSKVYPYPSRPTVKKLLHKNNGIAEIKGKIVSYLVY